MKQRKCHRITGVNSTIKSSCAGKKYFVFYFSEKKYFVFDFSEKTKFDFDLGKKKNYDSIQKPSPPLVCEWPAPKALYIIK